MDYLTEQEVKGFKQDVQHGVAKQTAEKIMFEKKLLDGLGGDMEYALEHPEERKKADKVARKLEKKKKVKNWKTNLKKILGFGNQNP